jgi:outer membrane lipoprotein LolB
MLLVVVLLGACSTTRLPQLEESERLQLYQVKSGQLSALNGWSIEGKLAVSNDKDGGSGKFFWSKNEAGSRMDFHGTLGRGAWKLSADAHGAELIQADGTIHRADSIDQLVRDHVGWDIPVESMSWWIRGLNTPGNFRKRTIDVQGNISVLLQDGWTVEYGRYRDFEGVSLPVRLDARQGEWIVKLVIRSWTLAEKAAVND